MSTVSVERSFSEDYQNSTQKQHNLMLIAIEGPDELSDSDLCTIAV